MRKRSPQAILEAQRARAYAVALTRATGREWVAEHRFHPVRKWRFDFACVRALVAVEIDGGIWTGGRHSGGRGQLGDMEKMNAAAELGWRVLHFTPEDALIETVWKWRENAVMTILRTLDKKVYTEDA